MAPTDGSSCESARSADSAAPAPLDPEVAQFEAQLRGGRRRALLLLALGAATLALWALALSIEDAGSGALAAGPPPRIAALTFTAGLPSEKPRTDAGPAQTTAPAADAKVARRRAGARDAGSGPARHVGTAVTIADLAGTADAPPAAPEEPLELEERQRIGPAAAALDPHRLARSLAAQKTGAVQLCFDSELKRDPLVHGQLTVVIDLRAPHEIARVWVRDTLRRPKFTRCVETAMREVEFPALAEDLTIELPFRLTNPQL